MKNIDLKCMTLTEAMEHAKMFSGKTHGEISRELSLALGMPKPFSRSAIEKWFNPDNDMSYFPSLPNVPTLCRILGNPIIIDWQAAQYRDAATPCGVATAGTVCSFLPGLVDRFGHVGGAVRTATEDGEVTPREAREIRATLAGLKAEIASLEDLLEPLAEKAKRRA